MTLSNSFYPVDLRVPILEMQRVAGIISGWLMGFSISIIPRGLYWHLLGQKLYPPSWEWHQQSSSVSLLLLKAIWRLDLQWEQTAGFPLLTVWNVNKLILPWPLLSASSSEHHCPLLPIVLTKWNELKWTSVYLIDLVYQNHNQPATDDNCDWKLGKSPQINGLLQVCNIPENFTPADFMLGRAAPWRATSHKKGMCPINKPHKAKSREADLIHRRRWLRHGQQIMSLLLFYFFLLVSFRIKCRDSETRFSHWKSKLVFWTPQWPRGGRLRESSPQVSVFLPSFSLFHLPLNFFKLQK